MLDGTHVLVPPPVEDCVWFWGRKKTATLNNLVVCNNGGLFMYAAVGIREPRNDKHLYNVSSLKSNIESDRWHAGNKELFNNGYKYPKMLLADNGFVLCTDITHPCVKLKGR